MKLGQYELGPNDTPENGIYCGDARELAKAIPDESVDLIFTDPVYDHVDDYHWLAEIAVQVLRLDSTCLVWCSKRLAARCQISMEDAGLGYVYTLDYVVPAKGFRLNYYHLFLWTTPCLWMQKGRTVPRKWFPDTFISQHPPTGQFKWNKNTGVIAKWLGLFSSNNGIIFDPFTGGGTVPLVCKMLGLPYLAFEIDPDTCAMARERVRNTQPPLFIPEPETQLQMI